MPICRIRRRNQFKNSQSNAASVDIFKNLAYCLTRSIFVQFYYRKFILGYCVDDFFAKTLILRHYFWGVAMVLLVTICSVFTFAAIKNDIQREHFMLEFQFSC